MPRYMAKYSDTTTQMHSGVYVDYTTITPTDIDFDDIAHGLGSMVRFNGQTSRPIVVGEHALRVGRLAQRIAIATECSSSVIAASYVAGLHHDDHEPYMPWGDCLGPGKTDAMRAAEDHVQAQIWAAMGWTPSAEVMEIVRRADLVALYYEATLWKPWGNDWSMRVWPGAVSSELQHVLLPEIAPRSGETFVDALVAGRWWGEAWARAVNSNRPSNSTKPWPGSKMLSGERML